MSTESVTQENYPIGIKAVAPWRVQAVDVLPDYCFSVACNDGTAGVADMSRLVSSEQTGIFEALQDKSLFNQVRVEFGVLTWPNGADLDPEWMHEEIGRNITWRVPA